MEIITFMLFNFIITFGSLFYVMSLKPTLKRLLSSFLLNLLLMMLALQFPHLQWLPISLCIMLGGGLFYLFTRDRLVFLHIINIHLITILIEYFVLFVAKMIHLPLFFHGFIVLFLLFSCLALYKKSLPSGLSQMKESTRAKWNTNALLVSAVTLILFYLHALAPSSNSELHVTMFTLAILLIYSLYLLFSHRMSTAILDKEVELKQREAERLYFYEYMEQLEETNKRMRRLQHDYSNILLSLDGYIQNRDMKGLAAYFDASILKADTRQQASFHQLENMEVMEIKGLVGAKLWKAQELHIAAQVEIPEKIDSVPMDLIDLTRILGIFLDNAIEASAVHEEPALQIAFLPTESNDLLIVIRNTTNQHYPDIKQLYEEQFSTKGKDRGVGLLNVKQLLVRHPAISLNTYLENGWFTQEMLIERRRTNESRYSRG